MSHFVVAEFHAAPGKLDELVAALKQALPETRAYDGCLSLDSWLDEARSTIVLTEQWTSFDHYDRYLAWRAKPVCWAPSRPCSTAARPVSSRGNASPRAAEAKAPRGGPWRPPAPAPPARTRKIALLSPL